MATQQLIQSLSTIDDDSTALFHPSPYPLYYIQSPSTTSNSAASTVIAANPAASSSDSSIFLSPTFPPHHDSTRSRLTLSPYSSSSRGSNNDSFVEEKKHVMMELKGASIRSSNGAVEEEEEMGGGEMRTKRKRGLMEKLVVLDSNESLCCVVLGFGWRMVVSLALALLVFFLATNPPKPEFSFKIVNVNDFSLGEGLDERGVPTKVLSCNCSVSIKIVNKSKLFALHIHPPLLELKFAYLKFASSQSTQASYVERMSSSIRRLFVGVKNKPMYGAGRSMEDLLESDRGLSLMVRIRTRSTYRVVWDLIRVNHHHLENCIINLQAMNGPKLYAQMYNNSCFQA